VDAYHSTHDTSSVEDLPIRGGALQGAVAIDYPAGTGGHRFDKIHIVYDGINGQLPNLDLINTVTVIGTDYMGIGTTIQRMWNHGDSYEERLKTMLHGMLVQGLGHASGPHSSFIPYHVDAITLQTVGDGWHDEMTLGRLVESTFRSLNNLLEHLHQSFFFYLLMHARRFVSIGTYLPSAMLVAINFSIMSIALWVQSGRPTKAPVEADTRVAAAQESEQLKAEVEILEHRGMVTAVPKQLLATSERALLFPLAFVLLSHFIGVAPLFLLHNTTSEVSDTSIRSCIHGLTHLCQALNSAFVQIALATNILPYLTAVFLRANALINTQALTLIPCISLLLLGIALATLSTLNFSLGLLVGLVASPLALIHAHLLLPEAVSTTKSKTATSLPIRAITTLLLLHLINPTSITYLASHLLTAAPLGNVQSLLVMAGEAWLVHSTYTAVIVWLVWFPAWFVGASVVACGLIAQVGGREKDREGGRAVEKAVKMDVVGAT